MVLQSHRRFILTSALAGAGLLFLPALGRTEEVALPALVAQPASEIIEAEQLYLTRPVIVFADTPNDPQYLRQIELLTRYLAELADRDVILITDTDPATLSPLRKRLRPRGFSLVIMDKDWGSAIRKPLPWEGREIVNAIDKMPIARSEALEKAPAGR